MKQRPQAKTADPPLRPSLPAAEPITRRELVLLAAILLVGTALRLASLSRSAVEHFDEGVYASNLYFGEPDFAYPQQRFYAPPFLPALIEAGMIAGLPPNVAALLPGFLAGCGTIAALWWFGRSWFGPGVGLAAATLAALSDFHVAYSAAALTDVLLVLWMVLAVDAIARSLVREDFRWAIGAGIYTGLAWWTKYNGWLPLAIEAAALPLIWFIAQRSFLKNLACFAVTAAAAIAVWSPYYFSLQSHGGYGPIAANHAKYVVGLSGWLDSTGRQISAQYVMEGLQSAASFAIAAILLVSFGTRDRSSWRRMVLRDGALIVAAAASGLVITSFVVAGLAAGVAIAWSLVRAIRARVSVDQRQTVATCLLAAWWLGLLVATPWYWPYPRLVLPFLVVAWLGTALGWRQIISRADRDTGAARVPRWRSLLAFTAVLAGICLIGSQLPSSLENFPRPDRRGLQKIAGEIRGTLPSADQRAVYVVGEPALFFQIAAAGEPLVVPVQDIPASPVAIGGQPIPTYLVIGPHAHRDPQFQQQWDAAKDRWQLVQSHDYRPSPLVWLDLHDPRQPTPEGAAELNCVEVYRLK